MLGVAGSFKKRPASPGWRGGLAPTRRPSCHWDLRAGARAGPGGVLEGRADGARILDGGGGRGRNAEAFVQWGHARGVSGGEPRVTVFDRPEVIEIMRETLERAGIETAAGDMNEELTGGPLRARAARHT